MIATLWERHPWRMLRSETVLRNAVCGALLLGIGWAGWHFSLEIHAGGRNAASVLPPLFPAAMQRATPDADDGIAALHLFGTPVSEASSSSATFDVGVAGIAYAPEGGISVAILLVNGTQLSYSVGSVLPNGGRLVSIEPQRVVIEQSGERRSLEFEIRRADPNAGMAQSNSTTIPVQYGTEQMASAPPVLSINPSDTASKLRVSRQNLVAPPDSVAGRRFRSAAQIRTAHRERVVNPRD